MTLSVPGTRRQGEGKLGSFHLLAASRATYLFLQWLASGDVMRQCQTMGCTSPGAKLVLAGAGQRGKGQITRELLTIYLIARDIRQPLVRYRP
jgi:hypothetical protein